MGSVDTCAWVPSKQAPPCALPSLICVQSIPSLTPQRISPWGIARGSPLLDSPAIPDNNSYYDDYDKEEEMKEKKNNHKEVVIVLTGEQVRQRHR